MEQIPLLLLIIFLKTFLCLCFLLVPKKLLLETQPKSTNYQGGRQTHFTRLPGAYDRDVIGDGVLFPDPAFITEQILPGNANDN